MERCGESKGKPSMSERAEIERLIGVLERGAERLRSGGLTPEEAHRLVGECADAAGRLTSALERLAGDGSAAGTGGQLALGSPTQERLL